MMKNKELLNILIKKLEKEINSMNYDYYSQEGQILDKIEQLLNIIKVINGETPFEDWYIEELEKEVE
jgi:hypothetical protein